MALAVANEFRVYEYTGTLRRVKALGEESPPEYVEEMHKAIRSMYISSLESTLAIFERELKDMENLDRSCGGMKVTVVAKVHHLRIAVLDILAEQERIQNSPTWPLPSTEGN